MRILQERSDLFERITFSRRFSHEFEKDKNHYQLKALYKSEKNANLCEFR